MRQLHTPQTIFSLRHAPSWLLLTRSRRNGQRDGIPCGAALTVKCSVLLRAAKILSFVAGAAVEVHLPRAIDYGAFGVAALVVAAANLLSFVNVRAHVGRNAPAAS